ncbi:TBC1 domain family member 5 homolog A [Stomoxys calcitrans]|uniref:TBC1 domain family member 5 homolog A n=1 Tax=Stomoxys calcitrans TaxID=35570 RepID=UPI0027E277AF|nr:TBC1 domain family member 5 homolog A [Stomoxys calcitrans]XP_059225440.1 TBC1 domain family member 5 homolog A [Stomoxys calcitrans]XP_059225441.1 TBC1 domain family member 5 homolog A [Stomoxys calcitrans]
MAPFKLKFRMGSSRSTSQEHEPDPQVNEALLNHQTSGAIGASSSTIDSVDCNSLVSLNASERKLLLPAKSNNLRMGFINQNQTIQGESIPTTPPPTYEHVLEEQRQLANAGIINDDSNHLNELEQLSLNELPCTDPNCQENFLTHSSSSNNNNNIHPINIHNNNIETAATTTNPNNTQETLGNNDHLATKQGDKKRNNDVDEEEADENNPDEDRKESIDSQELLLGENMTDSSSDQEREQMVDNNCTGNCQQYSDGTNSCQQYSDGTNTCQQYNDGAGNCQQYGDGSASCSGGGQGEHNQNNDFYDPLMNHGVYCNDASHYDDDYQSHHQQMYDNDGNSGECNESCTSEHHHWEMNQQSSSHQSLQCDSGGDQQQQLSLHQQQQQYYQQQLERSLTPEIISNKSSKEIYKDLAKQCGITCKMSDGCRCMECQSHYFDCEFDDNEHQKTDGGLGAGTPMFITEVMHGSACNIL